jgi:hypothetical protein
MGTTTKDCPQTNGDFWNNVQFGVASDWALAPASTDISLALAPFIISMNM